MNVIYFFLAEVISTSNKFWIELSVCACMRMREIFHHDYSMLHVFFSKWVSSKSDKQRLHRKEDQFYTSLIYKYKLMPRKEIAAFPESYIQNGDWIILRRMIRDHVAHHRVK